MPIHGGAADTSRGFFEDRRAEGNSVENARNFYKECRRSPTLIKRGELGAA